MSGQMSSALDGVGFGAWLRHAREDRGVTLDNIASQTKIPLRHLDALERGDFDALPPGFYQRSEVRAYASVVGLDQAQALTRFDAASRPVVIESAVPEAPPRRLHVPALPRTGLPIVGLAGAVTSALFWLALPGGARPLEPSPQAAPPPVIQDSTPPSTAAATAPAVVETGPPPLVDAETKLIVTTRPAGARVTVDGVGWGVSPVTIRYLPPGDKLIRVSLDGHRAQQRVVSLQGGEPQSLAIKLPAVE